MDPLHTILTVVIAVLLIWLVIKIFATPIKWALKLLLKLRLGEFWRHINGSFLLPVLLGIAIAIFSLARLMTYLLTYHPIAIWSFFFGLIIASALLVARQIGRCLKRYTAFSIRRRQGPFGNTDGAFSIPMGCKSISNGGTPSGPQGYLKR